MAKIKKAKTNDEPRLCLMRISKSTQRDHPGGSSRKALLWLTHLNQVVFTTLSKRRNGLKSGQIRLKDGAVGYQGL
jgi:hypothetical protein